MMNVGGKYNKVRRGQMKKRVKGSSLTRVTKIACLRCPVSVVSSQGGGTLLGLNVATGWAYALVFLFSSVIS
jgi:hypothetical protein